MSKPPDDDSYSLIIGDPNMITNLILKQDPKIAATVQNPAVEKNLVKYAKLGNEAAFEILYWRYHKPIWNRLVRLVASRQVAEDLHQETFIRAWSNLQHVNDDGFGPWLYRISANLALDYLRRSKKLMFLSFPNVEPERDERFTTSGPEKYACELDLLQQELSQIAPQARTCIILQDVWGYSQREIAVLLKVSVSCVGAYIHRGREQLRQIHCLNIEGGKVQ